MPLLAFDIETAGTKPEYALQPWRLKTGEAWITTYSICYVYDGEYKFAGCTKPNMADLESVFEFAKSYNYLICGWNLTFDLAWMYALGLDEFVNKCTFLDGMQLWKHATREPEYDIDRAKKKSYSLKEYVREYHPEHANYEDGIDYQDQSDEGLQKLLSYNHLDTQYTLIGTYHWLEALTEEQQNCAKIEAATIPMIAKANLEGMVIDVNKAHSLGKRLDKVQIDMEEKLSEWNVTPEIIKSPAKLSSLLYNTWQLPVIKQNIGKKTGKVSNSTDKEALHELSFIDERAKYIRTYRETLGNRKKFVETILDSVNYNQDGRTHPQAFINSTYTGRMTYGSAQGKGKDKKQIGFALHQEKSTADFRDLVVAPEGYTLVEADAANQEYRWMAIESDDETMLGLCEDGEDAHAFMASKISEYEYDYIKQNKDDKIIKPIRKCGKVNNLSLQYRTYPKKLRYISRIQYDMEMTLDEAKRNWSIYQQTYKKVPVYWDRQIQKCKQFGYAENLAGRRVYIEGDWTGPDKWRMESTAINFPIQSIGADQKYLALQCIKDWLAKERNYFAWDLHDGLYFYVRNEYVKTFCNTLLRHLPMLPYDAWGFKSPIPMPWDVKYGPSWGQLKEFTDGE